MRFACGCARLGEGVPRAAHMRGTAAAALCGRAGLDTDSSCVEVINTRDRQDVSP
jgi:hypothetical protein